MALLGVALYRLVIERVQRIDPGLTIVATFALALVAEACIALVWGPNPAASTPGYFNQAFRLGSLVVPRAQFYACLLAVGVTVALQAVIRRSWLGHAITAASENPEGARLVGVQPARVGAWIFAIATASSAFGGAALSFLYQFTPDSQDVWIGLTLSVVILGGLGSIPGAFAAGAAARRGRSGHLDLHLGALVRRGAHAPHPGRAADPAAGAVHPGGPGGRGHVSATAVRRAVIAVAVIILAAFPLISGNLYVQNLLIMTFLLGDRGHRLEHHGRLRRLHLPRQQPLHRARRVHDRHPGRPGAPLAVRRLPGRRPGLRAGRRDPEPGHPAHPRHVLRHRHVRRAAADRHRRDHLVRADRRQPGPGPAAAHVEPVVPELAVLLPAARPAGPDRRRVRRGPPEQARPRPVRDRGRRGQGGRARACGPTSTR